MADINLKIDVPALEPLSKATEKALDASTAGLGAVLGRICLPAAEEFGLLFQDKIRGWRRLNATKFERKLEEKLAKLGRNDGQAHPRLVHFAVEQASLSDEDEVQELWAGLLAGACDAAGKRQDNLLYMELLNRITPDECKVIEFIAAHSTPLITKIGLGLAGFSIAEKDMLKGAGLSDDAELQIIFAHLESLNLISVKGYPEMSAEHQTPWTSLCLTDLGAALHIRCQGYVGDIRDFYPDAEDVASFEREIAPLKPIFPPALLSMGSRHL